MGNWQHLILIQRKDDLSDLLWLYITETLAAAYLSPEMLGR